MDIDYSSTGLNNIKHNTYCLIFNDDTCPMCGEKLSLDQQRLYGANVNMRFICNTCGFVCPVFHNNDGKLTPAYSDEFKNFFQCFNTDPLAAQRLEQDKRISSHRRKRRKHKK